MLTIRLQCNINHFSAPSKIGTILNLIGNLTFEYVISYLVPLIKLITTWLTSIGSYHNTTN